MNIWCSGVTGLLCYIHNFPWLSQEGICFCYLGLPRHTYAFLLHVVQYFLNNVIRLLIFLLMVYHISLVVQVE